MVKNPPANAGDVRDAVRSLGSGRSPEEGKATHSSILAWRIPWTEEPDRQSGEPPERVLLPGDYLFLHGEGGLL